MYIKIEAVVRSTFLDEGDMAEKAEEVLDTHFDVQDLSVYEMPLWSK